MGEIVLGNIFVSHLSSIAAGTSLGCLTRKDEDHQVRSGASTATELFQAGEASCRERFATLMREIVLGDLSVSHPFLYDHQHCNWDHE